MKRSHSDGACEDAHDGKRSEVVSPRTRARWPSGTFACDPAMSLRLGTDCSGLETVSFALQHFGVDLHDLHMTSVAAETQRSQYPRNIQQGSAVATK